MAIPLDEINLNHIPIHTKRQALPLALLLAISLSLSACAALITPKVEQSVSKLRAGQYSLDKAHATLLFKVKHMGLSTYVGRFNKLDASLDFDPANIANSKLSAVIQVASLDINNPGLKGDLMGAKWFNLANHPEVVFETTSVKELDQSSFEFTGDLSWRGVTKPMTLRATFHGGASNILTGKYTIGFSAKGSFLRSDFGMDAFIPLVGNEIEIETYAEFQRN